MLNCRQVNELSSDYLESQMNWRQRTLFRTHLLICRHCRRFLRQLTVVRDTLRRLRPQADEASVLRVQKAIAALPPDPSS
ncbi:MAG: zf-HC2 domain-containing protein [Stenotrophobium sp.]